VGHVLRKVDAESCPEAKRAVQEKWAELQVSRPEPKIFWSFIESERNRFLKNYEHGIARSLTVPAMVPDIFLQIDVGNLRGGLVAPGSKFDSVIADGPYGGSSEREIAWKAHDWWKAYLDEVDALACKYRQAP
jgi:hypothetical protein